jgi:uncharacterized protein involved in exopolysaccharide biosynthesis
MAVTRVFDAGGAVNEDLVQLYDYFGAIRRRWIMIASLSLVFGIAMGILAYTMKPVYRGTAILEPVTSDNNALTQWLDMQPEGNLLSALMPGASAEDRQAYVAAAVLGSREFTERFLSEENLLPVLFQKKWDARAGRWKEGIGRIPTLELGYFTLERIRTIVLDDNTNYIELQLDWPDRFKAAEWVNKMAELLNTEMRDRAIASADASLLQLRVEFADTADVATRESISGMIEAEERKKMLANVMPEYAVRIVDKAVVPDADSPQRPKKPMMIGIGLLFGVLVGIALSLLLYRRELLSRGPL